VGVLGIVIGAFDGTLSNQAPALGASNFFTFNGTKPPMLPLLFITIACGACSGFHSIVASGTTSKQLENEKDACPVGYGGMLLESFLACLSLATVMIVAKPAGNPNLTYADGIAIFMNKASFGAIPVGVARQFGLLCFATFVFDTLDACTRLARYVFMSSRLAYSGRPLCPPRYQRGHPALVLARAAGRHRRQTQGPLADLLEPLRQFQTAPRRPRPARPSPSALPRGRTPWSRSGPDLMS
jgi:hypothetical protein